MVTAEAGEDLILSSADGSYAANQERAESLPAEAVPLTDTTSVEVDTPGQTSIDALVEAQGWHASQLIKVILLVARFEQGRQQPLLISLRGDQQLNEVKLSNWLNEQHSQAWGSLLGIDPLEAKHFAAERVPAFGYLGPDLGDDVLQGSKSWRAVLCAWLIPRPWTCRSSFAARTDPMPIASVRVGLMPAWPAPSASTALSLAR